VGVEAWSYDKSVRLPPQPPPHQSLEGLDLVLIPGAQFLGYLVTHGEPDASSSPSNLDLEGPTWQYAYTRANTLPGSPERKLVYAAEYKARQAREREQSGVSYDTARKLRPPLPLTSVTKRQVKRKYGAANVTKQGTRYALTRCAHSPRIGQSRKRVTTTQRQAIAAIKGLPDTLVNPVDELGAFYHSLGMEMTGQPPMSLQEASRGWKETVGQEPGFFESFGFGGTGYVEEKRMTAASGLVRKKT